MGWAGEVEAGGLLLHGHQLLPGELLDGLHPQLRGLLLPAATAAEKVKLPLQVPFLVLGDGVHQGLIGPEQLGAVHPHAVKGAALDEALQHPLVAVASLMRWQKSGKEVKGPPLCRSASTSLMKPRPTP